jgi:hypothetical protein
MDGVDGLVRDRTDDEKDAVVEAIALELSSKDAATASAVLESLESVGWTIDGDHVVRMDRRVGEPFESPIGWERVDQGLGGARDSFRHASTEEEFQAVGLHCREVLISVASEVYDPFRHKPEDGIEPSAADAKRKLDFFIASELNGPGNEEARRHAKAAVGLANMLQHRRTATFKDAALCLEATVSVAEIAAILAGRREGK